MLHRLIRSGFLRPRERLYELITLHQADSPQGLAIDAGGETLLDQRTIVGYVRDLADRALLTKDAHTGPAGQYRLTIAGRRRLQVLIVDFARELSGLNDEARELLRRSVVPLALAGVRRVAFYPFGETAEVVYAALDGLGFELVAIVDDASTKQGLRFHGLRVTAPESLRIVAPEAVVVTTSVFQDRILQRLRDLALVNARIHTL